MKIRINSGCKGFIFVTVIMLIAVMAIITLSVISLNSSQAISVEREIKRLQAESLGIGAAQSLLMDPHVASSITFSQTMDGTTFTVSTSSTNNDLGPLGTDPFQIQVQY